MPPRDPLAALAGLPRTSAPITTWQGTVTNAPANVADALQATSEDLDSSRRRLTLHTWHALSFDSGATLLPSVGDTVYITFDASGHEVCIGWEPAAWPDDPGLIADTANPQVVTVNSTTTLATNDEIALVTGPQAVYLPAAHTSGETHSVKDAAGTAGASPITVDGNGHLIDGAPQDHITTNWLAVQYVSNGTNWFRF